MSLINASDLSLFFGDNQVLKDLSFSVEKKDKIGLIGVNGAGKSTLFKLLTGEYSKSGGVLSISKDCRLGYMEQHACASSQKTVFNELITVFEPLFAIEKELNEIRAELDSHDSGFVEKLERQHYLNIEYERRGGLTYLSRAKSALLGVGFGEEFFGMKVSELSGGERSKLSLCKLLLCDADVLLLDEPTNHLDIRSVEWLESWLADYKGTFIVISHDRYFLDKVCNRTFEIENGRLYSADRNYSGYQLLKEERRKAEQRVYDKSVKEIRRIEGIIEQQKRFNQERNYITIASKQKAIDRIADKLVEPEKEAKSIRFSFKTDIVSGNDVLLLSGISKSFGAKKLFENVELDLKRGDRCFIIGENGCGKSTLLKIILNKATRDSGRITFGTALKIGYYDQTLSELSSSRTVIDEIWDDYRSMTETEVRSALALFLFRGDDVFKSMRLLSGGEKSRIALLKLMLSKPNFLILDEPTNNLDISSRQVLEDALADYDGTMLIVSHDRYFINSLATRIEYLDTNGLTSFDGNYDVFRQKRSGAEKTAPDEKQNNDYRMKKEQESAVRRLKGKISRLEAEIDSIDAEAEKLQAMINDPSNSSDYERIIELTEKLNSALTKQNELIQTWEELNIELEKSEGQLNG